MLQGSTRAFPPHHPLIPVDYQFTGQPVMIGGTMARALRTARSRGSCSLRSQGTCSYVLTGTEKGMQETFGRCEFRTRRLTACTLSVYRRLQHMPRRWQSAQPKQLAE